MADDYIDGFDFDPFDPQTEKFEAEKAEAAGGEQLDAVQGYLRMRQLAYAEVFSVGGTSQDAIDFVMKDLARFCRAYELTFNAQSQKMQDLGEGRREVFLRIMQFTQLTHEELYVKYVRERNIESKG